MKYRMITGVSNSGQMEGDFNPQSSGKESSPDRDSPPATSNDIVRFEIEGVMTCEACGTIGYAGERYCSRCGACFTPASHTPVAIRRCPDCLEPLHHPIAFFCAWCGVSLTEEYRETDAHEKSS